MINGQIVYKPPGPVSRAFMLSEAFVRGIRGPIGSGKSTACCFEILRRAQQQVAGPDGIRRSRWGVIRNSYPELKTTTIKTWHQWIPETVGRWRSEGPPTHRITEGDIDLEVMFLALDTQDDVRKLLSMELTGAWVNEAREVPKAVIDGLTGRVGRYPSRRDGGASWSGIIMDTNSPDDDHWWYRLAETARPDGWAFFAQPSGIGPDAENVANLPAQYYQRAMAGKDDDWVKVYVHGAYGFVREGKPVFPTYRDNIHCRPSPVVPGRTVTVGIDFGLTPAAVFLQRDVLGRVRAVGELVSEDMGAVRFAELLGRELRTKYAGCPVEAFGDPAGDNRAQTDETTPFQIINAAGVPATAAPSNDPVLRIEAVSAMLNRLVDGEPGFALDGQACPVLRKALGGAYCYRRVQVANRETYRDVPEKNKFSHVADALQYSALGLGEGNVVIQAPWATQSAPPPRDYDPFKW